MNHRHEDELPSLTPDQQVEAIRLAARLQAEHETRASSEALLRAAEEAGIEPRFLHEAAARIAAQPPQEAPSASRGATFGTMLAIVVAVVLGTLALPPLAACCLMSFIFAAVPASRGRMRPALYTIALLAWLLVDGVLATNGGFPENVMAVLLLSELIGLVVGVEFARLAARFPARVAERRALGQNRKA